MGSGRNVAFVAFSLIFVIGFTTYQNVSGVGTLSGCQLDSSNHPTVVLEGPHAGTVNAGDTIIFTGSLVCENGYKHSNVEIIIFQSHFLEDEEIIAIAYTDENGEFSAPWVAINRHFDSAVVTTIKAKYQTAPTETGSYYAPVSNKIIFHVKKLLAKISLDPLPKSAEIGETLFFTGKLELASGNPEGYIVYIKDEDPYESDDLLATAYVESDGSFSANWIVTNTDSDRIVDVYAVFEGAYIYLRSATCNYTKTGQLTAGCPYTIPLQITGELPPPPPPPTGPLDSDNDGIPDDRDQCKFTSENYNGYLDSDGCPDTPPEVPKIIDSDRDGINDNFDSCPYVSETFNGYQDHDGCPDTVPKAEPKEKLFSDEYMRLYFSHSFTKNPVVAIVPAPDSYDDVRRYIIPSQEGIVLWGDELTKKFSGYWNVDFIIIEPGSEKFPTKPDIIMNVVTRDEVVGCDTEFSGYASISTSRPVNTVVCTNNYGVFSSTSWVSGTASHEFIHAMGLGHAFNKPNDLMCSIEGGKETCPSRSNTLRSPSDFNLASIAKLYGRDGYEIPNNCPDRSCDNKFTAEQYMNFEYSPTTTPTTPTITTTPTTIPTTPTTPIIPTTPITPSTPTTPTIPTTHTTPITPKILTTPTKSIPSFVDAQKGAQHYLDRYNNEPIYKAWFDKNYPDYTIEQAIEIAIPDAFSKEPEPPPPEPEPPEKEKFCFLFWCW